MNTEMSPVSDEMTSSTEIPLTGPSTAVPQLAQCMTPLFIRANTHVPLHQQPTSAHSSQVNAGSEALTMPPPPDAAEDNPAKAKGAKAEGSFPSSGRHDLEPPAFFQPGKVDSQEQMSPRDRIFPPPRDIHLGSADGYADPHVSQPRTERISPSDSATFFRPDSMSVRPPMTCASTALKIALDPQVQRPVAVSTEPDSALSCFSSLPNFSSEFDGTLTYATDHVVLFWQPPSPFSHWTLSSFTIQDSSYLCVEQYLMAEKARLFGDLSSLDSILKSVDPAEHKRLGRSVSRFDHAVWDRERVDIAITGNYAKFAQNPDMRRDLLSTGDRILAEASPFDNQWGIGLRADNPAALHPSTWRGKNLLGQVLQVVRRHLQEADRSPFHTPSVLPPSTSSARLVNVADSIFEVNPDNSQQLPAPDGLSTPNFSGLAKFSPYAPKDHDPTVLTVQAPPLMDPPLPEMGPCLVDGIVTVDDASFTTRVHIHSGPTATTTFPCVALLDTGSPQSFINEGAWRQLQTAGAGTPSSERVSTPRSWGGFGTSAPLRTSRSIRLSVQFLRGDRSTASLAVWAYIVPESAMSHAVLLGRDSWMRFNSRRYSRPSDDSRFGELVLVQHSDRGAKAYARDPSAVGTAFHLRYAGPTGVSLSHMPKMLEVNLVRCSGAPALTGHYMVDTLPHDGLFTTSELFVADGRQMVPLAGTADLEPEDLLGTASTSLLRGFVDAVINIDQRQSPPVTDQVTAHHPPSSRSPDYRFASGSVHVVSPPSFVEDPSPAST